VGAVVRAHNETFTKSYQHWFQAVYQDKYEYLGDFDLMRVAFQLDLGLYYLGVASQPYKFGARALRVPVFSTPPSVPFFRLMRAYNRRFARMGASRRARGTWGRHNTAQRFLVPGFSFAPGSNIKLAKALTAWAWLEVTEGWRTWFGSSHNAASECPAEAKPQPIV
jgi:hypothetical protein